jgi:hypothetical protein
MGQSAAYSAPGIKAMVYLYDRTLKEIPSDIDAPPVRAEFLNALNDLMQINSMATPLGPEIRGQALHLRAFRVQDKASLIGLGVHNGKFVKVRITIFDDPLLFDLTNESILALERYLLA